MCVDEFGRFCGEGVILLTGAGEELAFKGEEDT
jgi:hypothetical protein